MSENNPSYANPSRRMLAGVVDTFLVIGTSGFFTLCLIMSYSYIVRWLLPESISVIDQQAINSLFEIIIMITSTLSLIGGAFFFCIYLESATTYSSVGKRVMGLRTVNRAGDSISFWQAFYRFLFTAPLLFMPIAPMGGVLFMFLNFWLTKKLIRSPGRCAQDLVTGTVVIDIRQSASE